MAILAAPASPAPRHVIYLHGRIVQERQSASPKSAQFGVYELEKIRAAFRDRGFVLHSEIRPKTATIGESADRVAQEVRALLASGLPADHIAVVGASMGASIALVASARLQVPEVRYAVLGACLSTNAAAIRREEGKPLSGRVLAIREASDDLIGPCPGELPEGVHAREIVLHTGLSHGFLYRPLPQWVDPVVAHLTAD